MEACGRGMWGACCTSCPISVHLLPVPASPSSPQDRSELLAAQKAELTVLLERRSAAEADFMEQYLAACEQVGLGGPASQGRCPAGPWQHVQSVLNPRKRALHCTARGLVGWAAAAVCALVCYGVCLSFPCAPQQYENELERLRTEGLAEHGALKRK